MDAALDNFGNALFVFFRCFWKWAGGDSAPRNGAVGFDGAELTGGGCELTG